MQLQAPSFLRHRCSPSETEHSRCQEAAGQCTANELLVTLEVPLFFKDPPSRTKWFLQVLGSKECSGTMGLALHPVTTASPKPKSWVPYPQLPWLKQHLTKHQRNLNSYVWVYGRNIYCKMAQRLQPIFPKKRKKGFYLSRFSVIPSWVRKALMFWKWCLQKLHCCFWEAAPLQKVQTNMWVKCIRDNHEIQAA